MNNNKYHYYRTFKTNEDKRTPEGIIVGETPLKALEELVKEKGIFFAAILNGERQKDFLGKTSNKIAQFLSEEYIKSYLIPTPQSILGEERRGEQGIVSYVLWSKRDLLEGYKIEKIKRETYSPWENGMYMTKVE